MNTPISTQSLGKTAEDYACQSLSQQGLKLLEKNYRCKCGEIDLIMLDDTSIVFVEVRFRKNPRYGGPAASIDYRKQQKIITTAQYYLVQKKQYNTISTRFDVVLLTPGTQQPFTLEWIQAAFDSFID